MKYANKEICFSVLKDSRSSEVFKKYFFGNVANLEAYSETCQRSKMERFAKIVDSVNYFPKTFHRKFLTGF